MPTLTETAPLLDAVVDGAPLERLLAPLRFPAPLPLDARSRARLGLPTTVDRAALAVSGSRRVLLLELAADDVTPEGAADSARTLARRHPAWHWLVIARQRATGVLTVLVPSPGAGPIPLLRLTRGAVRPSDVETVAALCAADGADPLIHQRWRETLGRDALTQRFYRDLEALVTRLANGGGR